MFEKRQFPESSPPPAPASDLMAWAIGPAFLALAVWFALLSPKADVPVEPATTVSKEKIAPGAIRTPMGDPPSVVVGGFTHRCNECHRFFQSPPMERRTLVQHSDILLSHGMNDRCFNCHDRRDRERLVLHDNSTVGFDQVPQLCAQCHGPVYADWLRGTHGKTMGSWDLAGGKQRRLECNECHDPHAPAYLPIAPLPAPNTLRMGDQRPSPVHESRHMPLRRWSLPQGPEHPPDHGPVAPGQEKKP